MSQVHNQWRRAATKTTDTARDMRILRFQIAVRQAAPVRSRTRRAIGRCPRRTAPFRRGQSRQPIDEGAKVERLELFSREDNLVLPHLRRAKNRIVRVQTAPQSLTVNPGTHGG